MDDEDKWTERAVVLDTDEAEAVLRVLIDAARALAAAGDRELCWEDAERYRATAEACVIKAIEEIEFHHLGPCGVWWRS